MNSGIKSSVALHNNGELRSEQDPLGNCFRNMCMQFASLAALGTFSQNANSLKKKSYYGLWRQIGANFQNTIFGQNCGYSTDRKLDSFGPPTPGCTFLFLTWLYLDLWLLVWHLICSQMGLKWALKNQFPKVSRRCSTKKYHLNCVLTDTY